MPTTTEFESEEFMTLLTDALRSGPGSAEWHEAMEKLRASGIEGADEYQLLLRAREDLQSGKEYRSVRAGAGFSRKVMAAIEDESGKSKTAMPSANIVALLAGFVILAVVVGLAIVLFKSAPPTQVAPGGELGKMIFNTKMSGLDLDGAKVVGTDFKLLGELPLAVTRDGMLKPGMPPANVESRDYYRGAIVRSEAIGADQAVLIEVTLKVNKTGEGLIPQVFVAEGSVNEKETSSTNELVWLLNKSGLSQVALPDGRVAPSKGEVDPAKKWPRTVKVKIVLNKDQAIVDCDDKRIYEGPNELGGKLSRVVGVRFVRKKGDNSDGAAVLGFNVYKP